MSGWKAGPSLVLLALLAVKLVDAYSYELNVLSTSGIPPHEENGVSYRMVAKQCLGGACSTVGINTMDMIKNALYTSDSLTSGDSVMIVLNFQKHERVAHPPNVLLKSSKWANAKIQEDKSMSDAEETPSFSVTGPDQGTLGTLHGRYHFRQTQSVRFIVSTNTKALRKCPNQKCVFRSTDAGTVFSVPRSRVTLDGQAEPISIEFSIRLHTFEGGRRYKPDINSHIFASHFVELARNSKGQELNIADGSEASYKNVVWSLGNGQKVCPVYKKVASLGGGLAHMWHISGAEVAASPIPHLIVAFHGSEPQSGVTEDAIRNEHFALLNTEGIAARTDIPFHAKVAGQYLRDYRSIARELRSFIRKDSNVLVTGFGRASGMATIAAADLVLDDSLQIGKVFGITFGSPQVGDRSFLRLFRKFVRQSPRFGFFDRLVAADSSAKEGVKVDPEVALPGAISEYMSYYPAVKDIDCLRQYADVASLPRTAAGHLSMYGHVGRQVLVFQNGRNLPPKGFESDHRVILSMAIGSNKGIFDMTTSFASFPSTDRFDIYAERLRFARTAMQAKPKRRSSKGPTIGERYVSRLFRSARWLSMKASSSSELAEAATVGEDTTCTRELTDEEPLSISTDLGNTKLANDEHLVADICGRAEKFCRRLVAKSEVGGLAPSTISDGLKTQNGKLTFILHRPMDYAWGPMSLRFSVLKQVRSPNCQSSTSSLFPIEHAAVAQSSPLSLADIDPARNSVELGSHVVTFILRLPKGKAAGPTDHQLSKGNEAAQGPSRISDESEGQMLDLAESFFAPGERQSPEAEANISIGLQGSAKNVEPENVPGDMENTLSDKRPSPGQAEQHRVQGNELDYVVKNVEKPKPGAETTGHPSQDQLQRVSREEHPFGDPATKAGTSSSGANEEGGEDERSAGVGDTIPQGVEEETDTRFGKEGNQASSSSSIANTLSPVASTTTSVDPQPDAGSAAVASYDQHHESREASPSELSASERSAGNTASDPNVSRTGRSAGGDTQAYTDYTFDSAQGEQISHHTENYPADLSREGNPLSEASQYATNDARGAQIGATVPIARKPTQPYGEVYQTGGRQAFVGSIQNLPGASVRNFELGHGRRQDIPTPETNELDGASQHSPPSGVRYPEMQGAEYRRQDISAPENVLDTEMKHSITPSVRYAEEQDTGDSTGYGDMNASAGSRVNASPLTPDQHVRSTNGEEGWLQRSSYTAHGVGA